MRNALLALVAGAAMVFSTQSAKAAPLAYEGFDYANGTALDGLAGGTGWTNSWALSGGYVEAAQKASVVISNQAFSYPGVGSAGNMLYRNGAGFTDDGVVAKRSFTDPSSSVTWLSYVTQGSTLRLLDGSGSEKASVDFYDNFGNWFKLNVGGTNANTSVRAQNWVDDGSGGHPVPAADSFFVVLKYDPTSAGGTTSMWVAPSTSPLDLTSEATLGTASAQIPAQTYSFDTIRLHLNAYGALSKYDEIRVGTTLADVVGVVPEPASLGILALGGLGLIRRRRA